MRTLCGSAFTVLAFVVAFVASLGGLAGCIDDGAFYWSGELPSSGEPPGGNSECQLEVDAPLSAGVRDPRSVTPARVAAHAPRGVWSAERAGFTTSSCD